MLQVACPWCGVRDEDEFRYGGEGQIRPGAEVDDARWGDYLFNRRNPKGLHHERWLHAYGCNRWFNAVRDTVTHEIRATYRFDEAEPELATATPELATATPELATASPVTGPPPTPALETPTLAADDR